MRETKCHGCNETTRKDWFDWFFSQKTFCVQCSFFLDRIHEAKRKEQMKDHIRRSKSFKKDRDAYFKKIARAKKQNATIN